MLSLAYGFLHRVFGWVVVLRAAAWVNKITLLLQVGIPHYFITITSLPQVFSFRVFCT